MCRMGAPLLRQVCRPVTAAAGCKSNSILLFRRIGPQQSLLLEFDRLARFAFLYAFLPMNMSLVCSWPRKHQAMSFSTIHLEEHVE